MAPFAQGTIRRSAPTAVAAGSKLTGQSYREAVGAPYEGAWAGKGGTGPWGWVGQAAGAAGASGTATTALAGCGAGKRAGSAGCGGASEDVRSLQPTPSHHREPPPPAGSAYQPAGGPLRRASFGPEVVVGGPVTGARPRGVLEVLVAPVHPSRRGPGARTVRVAGR